MSSPAERPIPKTPFGYKDLTADEKAGWLWNELLVDTEYKPTARPDLSFKPHHMLWIAGRKKVLAQTFDRVDDLMPADRPKIIHTQGSVALVELETFPESTFTGVLAPPAEGGGARGLVRMSLAIPPVGKKAVTPGMGLKLLIDGADSLDLLAMNHTVGQGRDFNLFSHPFTHDLDEEHTELRAPQRFMQLFFNRVSSEPRRLTIDHFAAVSRTGARVESPVVPYRLIFEPHQDVRKLFRGKHGADYRDTLETIAPGSTLYRVLAVERGYNQRKSPAPVVVGQIKTSEPFISSRGGERLFFRHVINPQHRKPGTGE